MKKCATPGCYNNRAKQRTICHKCRSHKFKENKPFRYYYNSSKQNAKKRMIPFSLTFREYKKIWIDSGRWEEKLKNEDWSLDRIDVNKGYEVGNVQVIPVSLNVELWYSRDRWNIDFRFRERYIRRNGVDKCPF